MSTSLFILSLMWTKLPVIASHVRIWIPASSAIGPDLKFPGYFFQKTALAMAKNLCSRWTSMLVGDMACYWAWYSSRVPNRLSVFLTTSTKDKLRVFNYETLPKCRICVFWGLTYYCIATRVIGNTKIASLTDRMKRWFIGIVVW